MSTNNNQWKENCQKLRGHIWIGVKTFIGGIIALSIFVYQTIISKTPQGNLHPAEKNLIFLSIMLLVIFTFTIYFANLVVSRTYRDEGMGVKSRNRSDIELMLFYSKMDQYFKNSVRASTMTVMLVAIMLYMALFHTYNLSIAIIFTGAYIIAVLMTFPNICKVQARKKTFVKKYNPNMTLLEMQNLEYEVAKTFRGEVVCSGTRRAEQTSLSRRVIKAKKRLRIWMATYILVYIATAAFYAFASSSTLSILGYITISTDIYFVALSLIVISFLFWQRYMYAHVTSGDALVRRKICRRILGEPAKDAA